MVSSEFPKSHSFLSDDNKCLSRVSGTCLKPFDGLVAPVPASTSSPLPETALAPSFLDFGVGLNVVP